MTSSKYHYLGPLSYDLCAATLQRLLECQMQVPRWSGWFFGHPKNSQYNLYLSTAFCLLNGRYSEK